jgi:hypothetical protein
LPNNCWQKWAQRCAVFRLQPILPVRAKLATDNNERAGNNCLDEGMVADSSAGQRSMTSSRPETLACRALAAQLD